MERMRPVAQRPIGDKGSVDRMAMDTRATICDACHDHTVDISKAHFPAISVCGKGWIQPAVQQGVAKSVSVTAWRRRALLRLGGGIFVGPTHHEYGPDA